MSYLEESIDLVGGLQNEVYTRSQLVKVSTDVNELIEYYHYMYAMLEKQQILLTRLALIDNTEYVGISMAIEMVADSFGRPAGQCIMEWHAAMKEEVLESLSRITGERINPSDIELDISWDE